MPPAARLTDMHVCPMVTGLAPHVGGPILPPCMPTVLIGIMPGARITDMAVCVGPPDVAGAGGELIGMMNGMPIVRMPDGSIKTGKGLIIRRMQFSF